MGITMRHVVWCSATLSLGAFFYVLTLEPMDERQNPRAAALDQSPSRGTLITRIRRALASGQLLAAEQGSKELILANPEDLDALFYRALVLRELGHDDQARGQWALLDDLTYGLQAWKGRYSERQVDYYRAWALYEVGDREEGRAMFAQIADQLERSAGGDIDEILSPGVHYNLACYRAMAGQTESALDHWAQAVAQGYGRYGIDNGWWMVDPDLESLHGVEDFWVIGSEVLQGNERDRDRQGEQDPSEG